MIVISLIIYFVFKAKLLYFHIKKMRDPSQRYTTFTKVKLIMFESRMIYVDVKALPIKCFRQLHYNNICDPRPVLKF